jgi:hypothetical protein
MAVDISINLSANSVLLLNFNMLEATDLLVKIFLFIESNRYMSQIYVKK